jgi:hypothetical protein
MQTAHQVWDEDHQVFKNCKGWAQYELPGTNDDGAVLCNGGMRTSKGVTKYFEVCPARRECRAATYRAAEISSPPKTSLTVLGSTWGNPAQDNKYRTTTSSAQTALVSAQARPALSAGVISPQDVQPAQVVAPPPPPPPQVVPLPADASFEERIARARTSLAQVQTHQRPPAAQSPYKYSGVTPDPKLHAVPVVPPTTHPAGMQSPFAHDPLYQHQIPVFVPTHTDDIGIRLFFNMLQSMVAAAGYALFSYARVVDLFAGLLR